MYNQYSFLGKMATRISKLILPRSRRKIKYVASGGRDMLVFANEDVGRLVWLFGIFEEDETKLFQNMVMPTDICIDVGGNVGYFSLLFAECASQGEVHVFEPIPLNAALIATNARLNEFSTIRLNECALSDHEGKTEFTVSVDSAYSSMRDTGSVAASKSISVNLSTLDRYCEDKKLPRVDILKVDVEGAEGLVLGGAANLLIDIHRRPRLIMLELFDHNLAPFGISVATIISKMAEFGYNPFVVATGGTRLIPFQPQMTNKIYNIFFVPTTSAA